MRRSRPSKRPAASLRPRQGPGPKLLTLTPALVAVVTFLAFLPTLQNGFVTWDDDRNFLANPHYRGLGGEQLHWMWTTFHLGHYVPLSWMSLGLDYTIWGMQPRGYHLTNLLVHALNAALVFLVARTLYRVAAREAVGSRITIAAAIVALVFAVHPLRVESVAWVTERRDVLSLAFMLLALLAYLRFATRPAAGGLSYLLAFLAFACALLSKATVMTLPAVLLLLNFYPLRRLDGAWLGASSRRVYLEVLPFAALSAGAVLLSIVALHPPRQLGIPEKLAVSAYSLAFYLWKTFVPVGLAPLYQMPVHIDPFAAPFLLAYLVVALFVCALVLTASRSRGVFVCLLAFLVLLSPMLGLVQNGPQIAADRYTYHAAPALSLIAGGALLVIGAPAVTVVTAASAVVIALLAGLTWQQSLVWRDSFTLWSHVAQVDPSSSIAQSSLASLFFERNDIAAAAEHSARAVALDPANARAHVAVGIAASRQGQLSTAIQEYQRAIALDPLDDQAESNWGIALAQQGEFAESVRHFERALFLNADDADAQVNWGNALVRADKPDAAIPHYRAALAIRPDLADAHHNWGVALARKEKFAEAADHFRAALELSPEHAEARAYLAKASALAAQQAR